MGFCKDGEGVVDLEAEVLMGAEKFVNGTGGAGELGVVVVMYDDGSLRAEARGDELEAGFDRIVEVAVTEGESDFWG